jgi:hypothetical protein
MIPALLAFLEAALTEAPEIVKDIEALLAFLEAALTAAPEIVKDIEALLASFKGKQASFAEQSAQLVKDLES